MVLEKGKRVAVRDDDGDETKLVDFPTKDQGPEGVTGWARRAPKDWGVSRIASAPECGKRMRWEWDGCYSSVAAAVT